MKKLVVLLMAMLVATSAFAIVDEDANSMGFYFDTTADSPCVDGAAPYSIHTMYMVITNPSFDSLFGFEAGYTMTGEGTVLSLDFANPDALNVGGPANMIVGFGSPSETTPATVVATLSVMYMSADNAALQFELHGTTPSSVDAAYPTFLLANSEMISGGLSTIDGLSCEINGGCTVVATEEMSFDSVKSLYR